MNTTPKRCYLDHNATSPLRPEVCQEIKEFLGGCCGNPSSIHTTGRNVRRKLDTARENVARLIGAKPSEIIFTSGGVEANHLVWHAFQKKGKKIATTVTEHSCIRGAASRSQSLDADIHHIKVHADGSISQQELDALYAFGPDFLSMHHANNETGALYDVKTVAQTIKDQGGWVHTDAVQTVGKMPVDVKDLGVDYLTISAHKLGALQGAGAVFVKKGSPYEALWEGGPQERGRRSGTENVLGILALGKACEILSARLEETLAHYGSLTRRFEQGMKDQVSGLHITAEKHPRIKNTSHMIFEGLEAESLMIAADLEGIDFSTGSACHSGAVEPSTVITNMGYDPEVAKGAVRFSVGWSTTMDDIERALNVLPRLIEHIRKTNKQKSATA